MQQAESKLDDYVDNSDLLCTSPLYTVNMWIIKNSFIDIGSQKMVSILSKSLQETCYINKCCYSGKL